MRIAIAVFAPALLAGCLFDRAPEALRVTGETMGTTYSVSVVDPPDGMDETALTERIEATLATVNAAMNNWDPDSEVSRLNTAATTDPLPVSPKLAYLLEVAMEVHALSQGRFDITLSPLIDLWGFGPRSPDAPVPSDAEIAAALERVGQSEMLRLERRDGAATLRKAHAGVSVNLSAIAKGYGVDRIAAALRAEGIDRYLVEIGGDLAASGFNSDDRAWQVGIERPDTAARTVQEIVGLTGHGLATSGDYRNYFEQDGIRYSHIIDPTTGRPIRHRTASVTVIAKTAMLADALATALLVVDDATALDIAETEGIAALLILRDGDGFVTVTSDAFGALMRDTVAVIDAE